MKKVIVRLFIVLQILAGFLYSFDSLNVKKGTVKMNISVIKRVLQEYYLLTKSSPIEINVYGPNWLRVYTRLLWNDALKDSKQYKIIVQYLSAGAEEEKIVLLKTEKSNSALGENNRRFGKWRSFFIDVPEGTSHYRLILLEAPTDTVAIRFSFEKPEEWEPVSFKIEQSVSGGRQFSAIENGTTVNYYEIGATEPFRLTLNGPMRLKVIARLNYDPTMIGTQVFTIIVKAGEKELQKATFRSKKSETVHYKNQPELIPSEPKVFYLNIEKGEQVLEFHLRGTPAKSAALRFLRKIGKQYE